MEQEREAELKVQQNSSQVLPDDVRGQLPWQLKASKVRNQRNCHINVAFYMGNFNSRYFGWTFYLSKFLG